jgi:peroxiredoxin
MKTLRSFTILIALVSLFAFKPAALNYNVGDTVSDFKLKNVDGKFISLADFKDAKGAIVIFDCNTCPFSKAYNQRIIALHQKYGGQGFPVIAINSNDKEESPGDSFEEMVRIAKEKKYEFPYLLDETQHVAKAFGATNTPHVFILKREDNNFKVVYIGAIDNNPRDESSASKKYVEDAVNALLNGQAVPTAKTKALGCGIRWKNA